MKRAKRFLSLILIGILPFLFTCGGGSGGNGGGGGDTTAPSTPNNLTATATSSSQIDLTWTASTDNVGVAGYKIYRDETYLKSVTTTSTSDTGLSANTQYCYTVSAYDAAGNESAQSNQVCAMTYTYTPEASATIGPSGGTVEVTNPSSSLYGVKVEIPAGALDQNTTITIWTFSKSNLEQETGGLETETRFFGGIKVDAGGAILNKSATISIPILYTNSIPNSFGATSNDQLLVGEVINLDSKSPSEIIYKGVAHVGSPITFNVSNFGSFGVLSPTTPLGLISGTFVNQSGNPVPNGVIATSFSKPFVAQTNNVGYFEIPAGPAGSYTAVMGIPPSEVVPTPPTSMGGVGIEGAQLPPTLPTPPTSLTDVIVKIIMDELDIPEPPIPPPCSCDPPPPSPVFTSKEDPEPPFELSKGQTIQTYMFGLSGVYGGSIPPLATFPLDAITSLWSGSLNVSTQVRFWTDDPSVATVDPNTGKLTAKSEGETWERAEVWITHIKNCGVIPCLYYLVAVPAKVVIEEECANIAGTWTGTVGDSLPITLSLSQDGCNVSGTITSPESCAGICGHPSGTITGSISGNNFSFTIPQDPMFDCGTCQLICYGTDQGSLTINGDRMNGPATVEDCEDNTSYDVSIDLTRSSSVSSLKTLGKKKAIKKSSMLSPKSGGK